jgi:DHA1 family multidrug resistance protein-like MFS transporter
MTKTRRADTTMQVNGLAAGLARGPVELLDFVLPLWAGTALGLSPAAIGALTATETLVSFLARPVAGVLADRANRGRVAAVGALLYALSFVGYAMAGGMSMALVAAVTGGVGGALFWVALRARVAEDIQTDSGVFAKLFAAEGTGTWIAFAVGITLVSKIDYRGVFWLCAASCAIAAVVLVNREPARRLESATPKLRSLGKRMWPLLGVVVITAIAEAAIGLLLLLHLQRSYHLELGTIAAVFLPGFIVYSTVPEFLHGVVTRLGRGRVLSVALVCSAIFAACMILAPNPWIIAGIWVLEAVALAAAIPVEQSVVAEAAGVHLGQGMAIYESATLFGVTIGALGAGLLYELDGGWALACGAAAVLLLTASFLSRPALRRVGAADRPAPEPEPEPEGHTKEEPVESKKDKDGKTELPVTWTAHAVVYLVVHAALIFPGQSWPVEALFGGPHPAEWFWNDSGDWLINASRIWTYIFVLDCLWTLGKWVYRKVNAEQPAEPPARERH